MPPPSYPVIASTAALRAAWENPSDSPGQTMSSQAAGAQPMTTALLPGDRVDELRKDRAGQTLQPDRGDTVEVCGAVVDDHEGLTA